MLKIISFIFIGITLIACQRRPARNTAHYLELGSEPTTLNPASSTDGYATAVQGYILESLLDRDIETYEYKPNLATEWTKSKNKEGNSIFSFKIRPNVFWTDGKPFTVEDVKYSFDVIFQDKFNTAQKRAYYEGIKEVNIIDKETVEFVTKNTYFQNFEVVTTWLKIIPKHIYDVKEKKELNRILIGTGPYKIENYYRGSRIVLVKNENWWGNDIKRERSIWNFPKIVLRFVADNNIKLEMLKKGSLDFLAMRSDVYEVKAVGPEWGKSVHKVLTRNAAPVGYNFIGWNLRHPILKDKQVRKALYHLVNRPLMIEKFEYNYTTPAVGPVYPSSPYASKKLKPVEFNPKKALAMLKAAGWSDTDGDNILDKVIDGKKTKFAITILEPWDGFLKYLTVFKEDAKKIGIIIDIKVIEWNSFIKLIDERKFDAIRMAWSASFDWDPKQIWHSSSIEGGSNFIGFNNPEVDRLIDEARNIEEREERIKRLNKVEQIIVDEAPYVWFTYKDTVMYGHTDRMLKEQDTYQYGIGTEYWQFKPVNEMKVAP
jgi:peptide/nickel transport system substrate-binding protein/microcin C transport system substrate-binding protein